MTIAVDMGRKATKTNKQKHFQRKDKIVKDFIILNQVVSEKNLMKNAHMCYIRETEGKI